MFSIGRMKGMVKYIYIYYSTIKWIFSFEIGASIHISQEIHCLLYIEFVLTFFNYVQNLMMYFFCNNDHCVFARLQRGTFPSVPEHTLEQGTHILEWMETNGETFLLTTSPPWPHACMHACMPQHVSLCISTLHRHYFKQSI